MPDTAALPPIIANCARCGAVDHTTAGHDAARPTTTAASLTLVYCSRCEALVPMSEDRLFRATQDHELDEHRDGYGKTIYTNLGVTRV